VVVTFIMDSSCGKAKEEEERLTPSLGSDNTEDLHKLHEVYSLFKMNQSLCLPSRSTWLQEWLASRTDEVPIYKEYEEKYPEKFRQAFRMSVETFYKLLSKLQDKIAKEDTRMRKSIPAKMRLQVTLRYYSSGASYRVLEELFRIPYSTISLIVRETSEAIWEVLHHNT
jgi:hypothetical protein